MSLDPAVILAASSSSAPKRHHGLDPNFQYISRKDKDKIEKFSEQPDFLKDLPSVWFEKIRDIVVCPKKHSGTACGIVVERYKYVALVFIQNSIGELCIIFRRLAGRTYHNLRVGTRINFLRCSIQNRVPRLIESAVYAIGAHDLPGFTEIDQFGWYTANDEFQLYETRMDDEKTLISSTHYGRIFVHPDSTLYEFLHSRMWTTSTVITSRIRYTVRTFQQMASFFEFFGEFQVIKTEVQVPSRFPYDYVPKLTDFL